MAADILFNWIRRTRIDGDAWELAEVPLGEASEAYRLEIRNGAELKRAVDVTTPSYRYTAAEIAADFGTPPASLAASISQISATYGLGATTEETFNA